jgi:hypothetical protein
MMALNFVEPRDAEQYAPVTMQDLVSTTKLEHRSSPAAN